jgi:predicted kinase
MARKLIITRGIPASGKSTWATRWVLDAPEGQHRARVNRDNIRWGHFGKGYGVPEKLVTELQNEQIKKFLGKGYDVVVDNTNLNAKSVRELLVIAFYEGAEVEFKDFPIPLPEALRRDAIRTPQVGAQVVEDFYNKKLGKNGTFPPVPELLEGDLFKPYKPTIGLPHAIIVDIDGTLAHMTNRGPYDTSKYIDDSIDWVVRDLVNKMAFLGVQIIIVSGRDGAYREVLKQWLKKHEVIFDRIFMRTPKDTRNDAIVKDEIFENHIKDNWYVDFVLDDRNRVIDMWRAKGISAFQVAYGDF